MASTAAGVFEANRDDVKRLSDIHTILTGSDRGRRRNVSVLNKASVLFVTACWESYVEDLLMEAVGHVVIWAPNVGALPPSLSAAVRTRLAKRVSQGKVPVAELTAWDGNGASWRATALAYARELFIVGWNTPSTANVISKFNGALGIPDLSSSWYWPGMSSAKAGQKLDRCIETRGNIAHRVHHHSAVHKNWTKGHLDHVARLMEKTDTAVGTAVQGLTGTPPW